MEVDKKILNVGLACLDIVMHIKSYPEEDSDQRCNSCEWRRGGNASNNCSLLKEFDVPCEYFGTISRDLGGKYLQQSFKDAGIDCNNCVFYDKCQCPTSVVLINAQNGSRTILHCNKLTPNTSYRDLPELCFEDFKKLDLSKYKWIHFEGRSNFSEIMKMINYIDCFNKSGASEYISISIELEKAKPEFLSCISCCANVVFISKDLAKMCNYNTMQSAVEHLSQKLHQKSVLICPWGENGACAKSLNGPLMESSAFPPSKVIDTLAAGDTFVAATIISLAKGKSLESSLLQGCMVAGAKCGIEGISGLHELFPFVGR